ncbi:MAG: fluoride efflux transporter CrcB [Bacteroidales bacterium]|nr:fluoride efflux transporter CrcB [Bacteroidales bacterium]
MWQTYLYVMTGGAIGALCRYLTTFAVQRSVCSTAFPWGTFCVNLTGSFLIGLLWGILESFESNHGARLFLIVGVLGGFTTFSSFSLESLLLFKAGEVKNALLYIVGSNIGGLTLAYAGYLITSAFKYVR